MAALLAFLSGYMLISYVLARNPHLLHKKRKKSFIAHHISHRGGAGECLENTMAAFKHAMSVNTDMFELDCHLTKDGIVVVTHDHDLERLTGVKRNVSDFNYHELPQLRSQIEVKFKPGSFCPEATDTQILRLRDLFAAYPTVPMNIDIKVDDDELMLKVSELIEEFNRESITVWGSRFDSVTQKLHVINQEVPLLFSVRASLKLILLYWTGLLPFVPIRETHLELPMPSMFLQPQFANAHHIDWKVKLLVTAVDFLSMRPGLFEHLAKRGVTTYLWVLNSEEEFERAFHLGCEGVMTDYPTKLRQYLDKHPEYTKAKISSD